MAGGRGGGCAGCGFKRHAAVSGCVLMRVEGLERVLQFWSFSASVGASVGNYAGAQQ
mgnify:CR=1 FL=1